MYSYQVPDIAGVGIAMCSERAFCDRDNRLDFSSLSFRYDTRISDLSGLPRWCSQLVTSYTPMTHFRVPRFLQLHIPTTQEDMTTLSSRHVLLAAADSC